MPFIFEDEQDGAVATAAPPRTGGHFIFEDVDEPLSTGAPSPAEPGIPAGPVPPAESSVDDWYKEYYNREMALQQEKGPDFRYQESLEQAAEPYGGVRATLSAPFRAGHTAALQLAGGIQNIGLTAAAEGVQALGDLTGVEGIKEDAEAIRQQRDSFRGLVRRFSDEQAAIDAKGAPGTSSVRQGLAALGEAATAAYTGGLPTLAGYYAANSGSESLALADDEKRSGAGKYIPAAAHAIIEGVATLLGGKLGSGTAALAGRAGERYGSTIVGKAVGKVAEKYSISKPIAEFFGAAGAEATEEMATEVAHYLTDKAQPGDYQGASLKDRLVATFGPAFVAGGAGRALDSIASQIEKREQALPAAAELARKVEANEPISRGDLEKAGVPSYGTNAKTRKEIARKEIESVQLPEAPNEQQPIAPPVPTPTAQADQAADPDVPAEQPVPEAPQPIDPGAGLPVAPPPPQGPVEEGVVAPPSTPVPPAQQGSTEPVGGDFELSREGSADRSPVVEPYQVPAAERLPPAAPRERQPNMPGMPTDMEPGTLPGQQGLFDQPQTAVAEAPPEPTISKRQLTNLSNRVDKLREKLDQDTLDDVDLLLSQNPSYLNDVFTEAQALADTHNTEMRNARSEWSTVFGNEAAKLGAKARRKGAKGGDAAGTFRAFDQTVQLLRDNPDAAPTIKAEAERIGDGDLEAGLFQVLQNGKTQFANKTADDFLPDLARQASADLMDFSPGSDLAFSAKGSMLGPSQPTLQQAPIKSQRQIITELSKGLNVPIRFGRLKVGPKAGGYFEKISNLIGSKRANDIPVVSHEVGHKLDEVFGLSRNRQLAAELETLGDPNTPGSRSSWTKSKSRRYKLGEGVAEFLRYWLTDPVKARQVAPGTNAAFEQALNNNKDVSDILWQAQEDIKLWRDADPQARLRSHISAGDNPNGTRYTLSQLTRDVVDDLHILRLAVDDAKAASKSGLKPSANPYLLARNLRGSYGMAETFIRNGTVDFNSKQVQLGSSLEDALKPVAGRVRDFGDWIVAKRAQELHSQGRETGLVPSDVSAVAAKFDAEPGFQQAFDAVKKWQDSLLQYAVDGGLVTTEAANAMRQMNQDYVPFHRLFEVGAGESPAVAGQGTGSGLNAGSPAALKRLKGSTRQIVDPLETMVKNAYVIITATEKAAINRAVADMSKLPDMGRWVERIKTPQQVVRFNVEQVRQQLEDAGADTSTIPDDLLLSFFQPSGRAPFGENTIRIMRNGSEEYYRLNRDLFSTFHALDLDDSSKLIRMLSQPAQLLRAGVTLEPGFALANILRDTFGAAVISKYGAKPFETTIRGVAALLNNPQLVADWAASGGKSSVEANFFDRKKLQRYLAEKISKDLTPAEQALVVAKSPLTALRWLTSIAEEATRIGEYQIAFDQLTQSGMSEPDARRLAAFEARDRQDFAKGGAKTKILRHATAFWNASLQGNVKLAEAFKQRPAATTLRGLSFVTLPTLLALAVNWEDEDYWDRPQWERDAFWLIPFGTSEDNHTRFIRIPKPFLLGVVFGTAAERVLQSARDRDPESVKDFPSLVLKEVAPNPMPQSAQLAYETLLTGEQGWDVFRQREIVPDKLADLPVEMQWTEQTSDAAKRIGKAIGVSPLKIEHAIGQTTGGLGKVLSGKQLPGERFVSLPLTATNQPSEDFYDMLKEMRTKAAGAKAGGDYETDPRLPVFDMGAKRLSELRNQSRETEGNAKIELDEQSLQLTKSLVALGRGEKAELPNDFVGRLVYTATAPAPVRKKGEPAAKFAERRQRHQESTERAANALKAEGLDLANPAKTLLDEYRRRGMKTTSDSYRKRAARARTLGL